MYVCTSEVSIIYAPLTSPDSTMWVQLKRESNSSYKFYLSELPRHHESYSLPHPLSLSSIREFRYSLLDSTLGTPQRALTTAT